MADNEMLGDAQFETELAEMNKNGTLGMWTARAVYNMSKNCVECQGNSYSKKQTNIAALLVTGINAVIAALTARFGGGV
jgi:hypothetical protein